VGGRLPKKWAVSFLFSILLAKGREVIGFFPGRGNYFSGQLIKKVLRIIGLINSDPKRGKATKVYITVLILANSFKKTG